MSGMQRRDKRERRRQDQRQQAAAIARLGDDKVLAELLDEQPAAEPVLDPAEHAEKLRVTADPVVWLMLRELDAERQPCISGIPAWIVHDLNGFVHDGDGCVSISNDGRRALSSWRLKFGNAA